MWSIDFYDVRLARLDARDFRLYEGNVASMSPVYAVTDVPGCYSVLIAPTK